MPDHTKKKKKKKKSGLFDRLKEMGRNLKSTLTAPQRRFEKSRKTTVSDLQKRRIKDTSDMSDAQKMRTRTKTDMSDTQKRPAKAQDTMSATQKRGAVVRSKKDVEDRQKKLQTNLITSRRSKESSNKTTVSDAQKKGTTPTSGTSKEPSTFKEAFRMARKEGKGKFTFKGKSYAAVTMDEVKKAKKEGKIEKATLAAYLRMKRKK